MTGRRIGVAIGSGGVYAVAGLGVIKELENNGLNIAYIAGASSGSVVAALYFLEGDAPLARRKLLEKLPEVNDIRLTPFGKPMSGLTLPHFNNLQLLRFDFSQILLI
jgi:predicted acylesterase/phospholipase RssA